MLSIYVQAKIDNVEASVPRKQFIDFLHDSLSSKEFLASEKKTFKFGLLIPMTSRGTSAEAVVESFKRLLKSISSTLTSANDAFEFYFFLGIDVGDPLLDFNLNELLLGIFPLGCNGYPVFSSISVFSYLPGSVCRIWADLAKKAIEIVDFLVLLGDDVELISAGWHQDIISSFNLISKNYGFPFGFGCVVFHDQTFPSFPSFPVLSKVHFEIFGQLSPDCFINQDLDPYLYSLYASFGATVMMKSSLLNLIGGANEARYNKVSANWKDNLLEASRKTITNWLSMRGLFEKELITLDIVVPTFRAPIDVLKEIITLPIPPGMHRNVIIIFDQPDDCKSLDVKSTLETMFTQDPTIRIRMNHSNIGASESRNRGLDEGSSKWVLFLDDDVFPSRDLLFQYKQVLEMNRFAAGAVGLTILPPAHSINQQAILAAKY